MTSAVTRGTVSLVCQHQYTVNGLLCMKRAVAAYMRLNRLMCLPSMGCTCTAASSPLVAHINHIPQLLLNMTAGS